MVTKIIKSILGFRGKYMVINNNAFAGMSPYFISTIKDELKYIIENKHLYQNHEISFQDFDEIFSNIKLLLNVSEGNRHFYKDVYSLAPLLNWNVIGTSSGQRSILSFYGQTKEKTEITFLNVIPPETVKLFCSVCKNVEPYNLVSVSDLLNNSCVERIMVDKELIQVFAFAYQCQLCKSLPEIFVLRRKNMKISITGRSPIEQFPVKSFIPKNQYEYFSQANIAFNSGQILAALFLLRTFIEQYIREINVDPDSRNIDELFEFYKSSLPPEFNSRFPSLKNLYDVLSIDLHSAKESEDDFLQTRTAIEKHFDAKRIFDENNKI